jgi:hypothetical protein
VNQTNKACQSSVNKKCIIIFSLDIIPAKHIQQELRYSHISHHHISTTSHQSNSVNKIEPHFYANIHGGVQGKLRERERERERDLPMEDVVL